VVGLVELLDVEELGDGNACVVDGNREADALGAGANRHVNADHLAVEIDEGTAAVAGIDAGVGLDQVLVRLRLGHFHVAPQSADDARGHRVLVAERVADGNDRFAEHQVGRGPHRHDDQRGGGVDLDHRQVARVVLGDDDGIIRGAVLEGDPQRIDAVDDVVIRDDVAPLVDDDAGPHPVDLAPLAVVEQRVAGEGRLFAVDVHHRRFPGILSADHHAERRQHQRGTQRNLSDAFHHKRVQCWEALRISSS